MLEYVLGDHDLGEIRFGISPLAELTLSLRSLRHPGRFPLHTTWMRETAAARSTLDLELLEALVDERGWVPDFLTPRPAGPLTDLDDELSVVSRMPARRMRAELDEVHDGEVPAVLTGRADAVRRRMVRAMRGWWDACLAPYWPRMRRLLEADIAYRGREQARGGTVWMMNRINERISLRGRVVRVVMNDPTPRRVEVSHARGLTLMPTLFNRFASVPMRDDEPPAIMYNARGQANLWLPEERVRPSGDALAAVVGPVRAHLLTVLGEPASSSELADRLDVTPSAVNQQLRALHRVGLVTRRQHGRSVLYLRSDLGDMLAAPTRTSGRSATTDP
jgi:DNA-binding transcriptional ArsR family regulator